MTDVPSLMVCLLWLTPVELIPARPTAQQLNISQLSHVLVPGEFSEIKVFQEPDLDTAVRIPGDGHITVKRRIDGSEKIFRLDGKRLARGESGEPFSIVSGDVISVGERLF